MEVIMQRNDNIRIYVVDDDPDEIFFFKDALSDAGIPNELTWFQDGQSLLSEFTAPDCMHPDMLFLDLNMPLFSGMECLRALRNMEKLKDLTVIIYSTSSQSTDIEKTFAAGADYYLVKPGSYMSLKQILHGIIVEDTLAVKIRHDRKHFVI